MERRTRFVDLTILWLGLQFVCKGQISFPPLKTTQGPTYYSSTANRAIDGNINTCSLTVSSSSSDFGWWQVDLGDVFTVYSVTLTTNTNGNTGDGIDPQYLQNFAITVGLTNSTDVTGSNICYYFNNGSYPPALVPLTLTCTQNPLNGRYVTIVRRGGYRQDVIGMCEANIRYYTVGYIYLKNLPTNQTGGYTDAYGTFHGSNLANDLNLQTCSEPVNPYGSPFWYIDLQDVYAVTALTAFNQDSNAYFNSVPTYLSNFYVRVGNSSDLSSQQQCCYYGGIVPVGGNVTCYCQSTLYGRYVSIERVAPDNNPRALVVCEVLIQGYKSTGSSTSSTSSTTSTTSTPSTSTTVTKSSQPSVLVSFSTSSGSSGSTQHSFSASVSSSETPHSTPFSNGTAAEIKGNDNNTNIIIICVVVIIGGLLLIVGAALLAFYLLRGRCKEKIRKPVEILPFRRMSENPYANVAADHEHLLKPIQESNLVNYVEGRKSNPNSLKVEFKKLPEDEAREATLARKSENKLKNRFANVLPYDHTLVLLDVEESEDPTSSYINANYIEGYKNVPKMYIATQGPRPNTLDDFWRMIWQQNVNLIVMVTSVTENGKKKCEKYWPESLHSKKSFNRISVTLTVEETYAYYAYREMAVQNEKMEDGKPRTVRQLHFLTWSDKTRPDHFLSLLSFRRKIRTLQKDTTGPVVIHCSAGIGRTGTYIALDTMLEQLKDEHEVSIFGCVEALRYQRMGMVQTPEQYLFLHEALADGMQGGDTGIPCSNFVKVYIEMSKPWPDGSLSSLEQQFILLKKLKEFKGERYSSGYERKNLSKNRDKEVVAYDEGRPRLQCTYNDGTDYINAAYADSYRAKDAFIMTQLPLEETVVDFWRMIWDHRLKTIVLLEEIDPNDKNCPMYWPEGSVGDTYGPFDVEVMQTRELSQNILVREFSITNTKERQVDPQPVLLYQFKGWINDALVPHDANMIMELMTIIMANTTNEKIVVQCHDGVTKSGLFASAMYMLDMMKVEQVVDVFLACRFVAIYRPQVISSMEQYVFLHDIACACLMQYEEYDPPIIKNRSHHSIYANANEALPTTIWGVAGSNIFV